jgi:hypothetical protein
MAALSCTASLKAQDSSVGIVRISDGKPKTPVQNASFHGHGGHGGYAYGDCNNCDNCNYGGKHCHGWFQEHYCKNSPDHGYSPPAKYPLHRRGVQYTQTFPNQWYGLPGASYQSAPMVYQPTDTTQLGYTYQHVPFWQPNPSMMPKRPVPAQWHIVAPAVHASSFHNGYGGCMCPSCQMQMQSTVPAGTGQPTLAPGQPTPTDLPEASLPPAPRQFENAASGHIRRAVYE